MTKKVLMIFLVLSFCLGLASLLLSAKTKNLAPSIGLPLPTPEPTPLPTSPWLSPPPANMVLGEIENDLRLIEADLKKMKEDSRSVPPEFIFDLGVSSN